MYYLKHNYTDKIYFTGKENLIKAVDDALILAEKEFKDGFNIDIEIGYTEFNY
jgi:hypothetical protein